MYKKNFLCSVFLFFSISCFSQQISSLEFRNQEITDILMVLAEISGTSIIPDETVSGTASFYFSDSSIDEALSLFLPQYKLYYTRENNSIKISRIKTEYFIESDVLSVKADEVSLESLIKSVSKTIAKTILYDSFPYQTISIDAQKLPADRILEIITRKLVNYKTENNGDYYYIRKNQETEQKAAVVVKTLLTMNENLFTANIQKASFLDTLTELFSKAGREYSLLTKSDTVIEHFYFADKDFETMLNLLLEQGNADYALYDNVYYIVEIQRNDVLKKLRTIEILPLTYISAQEIGSLLPPELIANSVIRTDKNNNTVLLSGTQDQITPLKNFITRIDRPATSVQYKRMDIKFLKIDDVISIIPAKLVPIAPVKIAGTNSFMALGSKEILEQLSAFIAVIDKKESGTPVWLKYVSTADLLKNLPPSITKEEITDSGYPNLIFFTGSPEKQNQFIKELNLIDRPKPQITYQLLVIQYSKGKSLSIGNIFDVSKVEESENDIFTLLGNFTQILSLDFDVISKFGYQFAMNLNAQLGENTANVFVDTTLNGISGQTIKFQNTDTYRYQEAEYDDDTKKVTQTGVTQEITSGLIIDLNGWVSGDDMITMNINATVSKRNSDVSSSNQIPSTSERIVNTQVRTPSGEPIIISGLIKEDNTENYEKIPLLGSIPGLGYLFRDTQKSNEKTEIVIYIVPHLKRDSVSYDNTTLTLERYYQTFVSSN